MTGEFYALLRQRYILARWLPENDAAPDAAALGLCIAHARRGQGLLHTAFMAGHW